MVDRRAALPLIVLSPWVLAFATCHWYSPDIDVGAPVPISIGENPPDQFLEPPVLEPPK